MEPIELQDMFGEELNIGDYIVYPVRSGSSMWMKRSKLVEFRQDEGFAPHAIVEGDSERSKYIWNTPDGKWASQPNGHCNIKEIQKYTVKYRRQFTSFDRCVKWKQV